MGLLHQQGDSKIYLSGLSSRKEKRVFLSTADKQYLNAIFLRNKNKQTKKLAQDRQGAAGPSVDPSTGH